MTERPPSVSEGEPQSSRPEEEAPVSSEERDLVTESSPEADGAAPADSAIGIVRVRWVVLTTILLAGILGFAFRPELAGTTAFWLLVAVPNLTAAAFGLYYLHREDLLFERLRPRGGDVSMGVALGVALLIASWAGRATLATVGTPQQAWLINVYIQIGDPELVQSSVVLTSLLLLVVVAEELTWRGWALDVCNRRVGTRRGWMLATLLYAGTMALSVFSLAAPGAGLNPLLLVAALFCGCVWSFTAHIVGRLPPVIISHAIFTYFSVVQFRLPGT